MAYVGIDIFTGKKYEDSQLSAVKVRSPILKTEEYELMNSEKDGFVSLMTQSGEAKEDLRLPEEEEHKKLYRFLIRVQAVLDI